MSLYDLLFNLHDNATHRHNSIFTSTLVLPGLNVYEGSRIDDPEKVKGRDFVFRAQGRDLNGANFELASLPKVDFTGAQLRGAWLFHVQLQGARLDGAASRRVVARSKATCDRSFARASVAHRRRALSTDVALILAVRLPNSPGQWLPVWRGNGFKDEPWNDEAFQHLRQMMESLPPGAVRDQGLDRIGRLDCANPDPTLASCNSSGPPPPEATLWRKSLEDARVDDAAYAKALAWVLKPLVCSGGDAAANVLRGLPARDRLAAACPEAPRSSISS